jgi:hypothetical protein
MVVGITTSDALADSLDSIVASARISREQKGVMPQLVDVQTLSPNTGGSWKEVTMASLEAQAVGKTTDLDENPTALSDSSMSITPTMIGMVTILTDEMRGRISKLSLAQTGMLAQNAIQRKKDLDGLVMLDGASVSLCGAGSTLTSGHISAAVTRITSNATEPGMPPIYVVLNGNQIKDIKDELTTVGTYPIPMGMTAEVYSTGQMMPINGAVIFEDGNITADSSDDAKGGVFAKEGIVLVQEGSLKVETMRKPNLGGGADAIYMYDAYAYGERSSGNWVVEIYSDATTPSS